MQTAMCSEYDSRLRYAAYVGLGSNMGDARSCLRAAIQALRGLSCVRLAVSPMYLTEPQGDPDQPWFVNQVAGLVCAPGITPISLLRDLQTIEQQLGRKRDSGRRYGPRIIDLDLLVFGEIEYVHAELIIPHPRLHERAFVLAPLCDLAADLRLPGGHTPRELLRAVPHIVQGRRIFQSTTPETSRCSNGFCSQPCSMRSTA